MRRVFGQEIWFGCTRYAEPQNWKVKLVSESLAEMGALKTILEIQGDQVYSKPKFEAGVHRVQRVPVTEAGVSSRQPATVADAGGG